MYFAYISVIIALLFSGCSTVKHGINQSTGPLKMDSSIASKIQGSGSVTLLGHQLLPIDYLHKNPQIKGILINHYMGTGKTFLGISMAESFPGHPVIILAPRYLESHWMNQLEEYGVKDQSRYTFVSYEEAPEKLRSVDMQNHILLADEVHNLVKHMRSYNTETSAQYTKLYTNLRKSFKILGLTGTPLYSDE